MSLVRTFVHENPVSDEMKAALKVSREDRDEIKRLKVEIERLSRELAEARAALRLARERICTDRKALNTLSDLFQAQTDKADLCDARIIQDRADDETFKIIDRALAPRNPADGES